MIRLHCLWPLLAFAACDMKEPASNMANIQRMQDTIFTLYPTVNRATVEVKDFSEVIVTLGDAELFTASDAERQRVADGVAKLSVHFFKDNNDLKNGSVIFVKEENTLDATDKKMIDMHLENIVTGSK